MLPHIASEFSNPRRYHIQRLTGSSTHGRIIVDVGCNLGDFSIAAWQHNPDLHILCLEPMPVTYLYLRWNLHANGVALLTPAKFGAPGQPGGVLALQAAATAD